MARRDTLIEKCKMLGLTPETSRNRVNKETGEKYQESTIDDCIKALQDYYINVYETNGTLNPFVKLILKHPPMLAAQMKTIKEENRPELWKPNNQWIATEKIDGNRIRYCYNENYGVEYFSRNLSDGLEGDYLPIAYSDIITIPHPQREILTAAGIHSFIIDGELVPFYDDIRQFKNIRRMNGQTIEVMEYPVADTQLNLTTSILGALPDLAHRMQETNPLKIMAFDVIMINGEDLSNKPLRVRLANLMNLLNILRTTSVSNRVQLVKQELVAKEQFYQNIINAGGEGCVLKDLNSPYTGKRDGNWIKAKRTVSGSFLEKESGDTIDAFVIGFKEGNKDTNLEGLIGALDFGTYLLDDEGNFITDEFGMPVIHHIATISGLTLEERTNMTEITLDGRVTLKTSYYNRVAEIDGQDISSKNYRLAHAVIKRWRPDRSSDTCMMKESFMKSLIL